MLTLDEMMDISHKLSGYLQLIGANHLRSEADRDAAIRLLLGLAADFYVNAIVAILKPTDGLDENNEFTQKEVMRVALFLGELLNVSGRKGLAVIIDDEGLSDWRLPDMKRNFNTSAFDDFVNNDLFGEDDDDILAEAIS